MASATLRLQLIVFLLVSAAFTNIYITQPVLPVLQQEFSAELVWVSFTVSAVILGIALTNLPFGMLVDRFAIQPIIFAGGVALVIGALICATTEQLWLLIGARFFQGLFIPALTTCLVAYLAKTLPPQRLNVVMGSYVAATVLGGLGGRLLGGWIHPPLHWRYAFISTAVLTGAATLLALWGLPKRNKLSEPLRIPVSFIALLKRPELLRIFFCAAGSFGVFSLVFNYLPFRLAAQPFELPTELITALYIAYLVGVLMGPFAGRLSNRYGNGNTILGGALLLGASLLLLLVPSLPVIIVALLGSCGGFFTLHSAAVGALNRKLEHGHGRANALYVLFYYCGGWLGITAGGVAYQSGGWGVLIGMALLLLLVPVATGVLERQRGGAGG